ncbi:uroporphyrinogen-III C-methyltransferase [Caminibacter mediatlanticus]|uniref:SIROHEME SYNTHASE n=1 Tax=Caminibacter mediatlanticus TB-2 TaxID=391592 RepID=A0AAI9AHT1_9BACT|nr:uroporphyrinogen-III C-methyltransferase [Caminibacter mediatlanticus]EDM23739.1 SIROHEME SYNTHASE [Caminibacter mediatlanticus TB-2]
MLINLVNKKFLVIGAGKVAKQKCDVLSKMGEEFKVIAKEKMNNFPYEVEMKEFSIEDTKGFDVVIDATGNEEVTKKLIENKNFLLNVVDKPEFCDFYFGSIAKKGNLSILVSSNGTSPRLTQVIRDRCDRILGDYEVDRSMSYDEIKRKSAKAFLIGCGPGALDLLTIRAFNTLKTLEVALYDHLVNPDILELLPKKCEKIYVGKVKGKHSRSQEEINEIILKYLNEGKIVGRLKSGHPFVFGRGAEEVGAIVNAGFEVEVVEGLSSAISGPTNAGIPLTIRGSKDSFIVVSAHLKGNRINLNWIDLLLRENIRVIVLMGLSRIKHIQKKALEIGVDENREVYIISNVSLENQITIKTTIKDMLKDSKKATRPAIIVF